LCPYLSTDCAKNIKILFYKVFLNDSSLNGKPLPQHIDPAIASTRGLAL
jgi:hypothetical protein